MYDIITIGSATRDVFARSGAFDIHKSKHAVGGLEECLPLGAKIEIKELVFDTGGGATNAAVAFANFGMKTAAVCRVGSRDFAAKEIIKVLNKTGVDTRFITFDPKERTAYSIILLTKEGERTILVYRGASKNFGTASMPWKNLKSKWLYISSLGGNLKLLSRLLGAAQKNKIKIGWNPGGQEIKMGFKKLKSFIKKVNVLIMNEEETMTLFSVIAREAKDRPWRSRTSTGLLRFAHNDMSLEECIKLLRSIPCRALVVTKGGRGAIAADKNEILYAPALDKKVVNTTGAGDAFSSGFIAGLWKWDNLSLALRLGILNSGMCIAKMGAKNGLLTRMPSKKGLLGLSGPDHSNKSDLI